MRCVNTPTPIRKVPMRFSTVLSVALLVLLAACVAQPGAPELGRIDVYVRDQAGTPVNGVAVQLRSSGGNLIEEGPTGSVGTPGYYLILRAGGEYRVQVVAPAGYTIPASQTNPVPVSLQRDATVTVNFTLAAN